MLRAFKTLFCLRHNDAASAFYPKIAKTQRLCQIIMSAMRKRASMMILVVLVAGGATYLLGKRSVPPVSQRLSISFEGYSNSPSGKVYALFAVTNHDTCDIQLWNGGSVEFLENEGLTNGRPPDVEVFYSLVGSNLCRGKSYRMFTEVPGHREKWRLTWMVMRSSLANRIVYLTSHLPLVPTYRNGTPDFYYFTSDWIP